LRGERSGLSSVYGFIVIFTLLIAGISVTQTILNSQKAVWDAQDRAKHIEASQQLEHLTLSLTGTSLKIQNVGLVPSQLMYLHQVSQLSSKDQRLGNRLSAGNSLSLPVVSGMQRFALVTSLGNVFWVANGTTPSSLPTVIPVIFDASGLSSLFASATVLTVDGVSYIYSTLPKTFDWSPASVHTYSYVQGFPSGPGSRVGWTNARGISSSRTGNLTAIQPGSVVSYYSLQYLLTVTGGDAVQFIGSPGNDGWYGAGSTGQFTSNYIWNIVSGSRTSLVSYSIDGSSPTSVVRSGSGVYTSVGVTMTTAHAVALNAIVQYQLSVTGGNGVTASGSQTSDGWFDSGSPGMVTTNYAWSVVTGQSRLNLVSWNLDGGANQAVTRAGSGTFTTTPITMNTFHTVNFNSVTQYYLTAQNSVPSGTVPAITISYSYTQSSTTTYGPYSGSVSPGAYSYDTSTYGSHWIVVVNPPAGTLVSTSMSGNVQSTNGVNGNGAIVAATTGNAGCWAYTSGSGYNSLSASGPCGGGPANSAIVYACPNTCPTTTTVNYNSVMVTYTVTNPVSGSASSSSNTYSVSGGVATYTYGVGYSFPGSSSSTFWSATWPSSESYSSNNCSGSSISGNTISGTGGPCTLTTTGSGSYSSSIGASQTGDSWYDSGSSVSLIASASGPFSFSSWSSSSSSLLLIASSSSASTTVTVNTYGRVTASFSVNQ